MKVWPIAGAIIVMGCSGTGIADQQGSNSSDVAQLKTVERIQEMMEAFGVTGLAVSAVSGDRTVLAQGFGETQDGQPFTATTRCGLFSATKVLASLTYANLAAKGSLTLDAPIGSYIADAPADWRDIPFYRLLNHTSGITMIVNKDEFADLASDPRSTNAAIYKVLRDEPLDYQPGQYSRYRQSGYAVGEMVLQDRLGKDFATLVRETITQPAGMVSTAHPATTDETQPALIQSAGGFETTAADMAAFFKAVNAGTIISADVWKDTLLKDAHLFRDYSLGSVIEYNDDVLSFGHSGGGARANVRYAPDHGVGAMVCTDDQTNQGLAMPLARILLQEIVSGTAPALPILVAAPGYTDMTAAEVIAAVEKAENAGERFDLSGIEGFMNEVGYTFLSQERGAEAIEALAFNVARFPNSPNAHDSLGEALFEAGKLTEAREQYAKVLELDPGNDNATRMLSRIDQS